jgi:two-component system LytT family sensor kinase
MDAVRGSAGTVPLRERGREWLGVAGLCFGLALAYSLVWKLRLAIKNEPVDWGAIPTENLIHFGSWLLLYPGVVLLTSHFPLGDKRRRNLLVHAFAALVFSPLLMALSTVLNAFVRGNALTWIGLVRDTIAPEYAWGVTAYIMLLSVAHAAEFRRREQARALGEVRLETALALAQLSALRMQLEPHFLFNALNSISSLLRRDPDGAERMIARLGDFLRLTLDESMPQKVELRQELEFLERYLDIERVRFRDRLTVTVGVSPGLLDARVPYLLLQPLVENAIRHGVALRSGPSCVTIKATSEAMRLCLEIEDDGPGLPSELEPASVGVGLSNTRARLQHLYGGDGRLSIGARPGHGVRVTIELPWERGATAVEEAP